MKIVNNWLVEDPKGKIFIKKTSNLGGAIKPKYLVIHYTASDKGSAAVVQFATPNKNKIAAHIVLDKDGTITHMVPFNRKANHAGYSTWDGDNLFNGFSIGIEIANAGFAEKLPDGSFRRNNGTPKKPVYQTWPAGTEAVKIDHKHKFHTGKEMHYWFVYPKAQLNALYELSKLLVENYKLRVVGHDDISAGRKLDPGPAFPWDEFKMKVFGKTDNTGRIFNVNKGGAEFRESNSATSKLIRKLPEKYEVGLISTDGDWSKVYLVNKVDEVFKNNRNVKINGWVLTSALTIKAGQ